MRTGTPHAAASPSPSNTSTQEPTPRDERDAFAEESSAESDIEKVEGYFYSLGQVSAILKIDHAGVKALAAEGKLRTRVINGWLWFPAKDLEDFVIRQYGRGRLVRAPDPYPVAKVRRPNPNSSGGRSSGPTSSRPPENQTTPTAFEEDDGSAATDRAKALPDSSVDRKLGTGKPASAEYLTVPEAVRELGESIPDVLGRIGRQELPCERISGRVLVKRQFVLEIKEGTASTAHQPSQPAGGDTGLGTTESRRTRELRNRVAALENQLRAEKEGRERDNLNARYDINRLANELEAERARREESERAVADLRAKLAESEARRRRAEEALLSARRPANSTVRSPGRSARVGDRGLYPWQREALDWWQARGHRGVVEAVTGAGKTRLAVAAIEQQLRRGEPAVVVVPTRDLLYQWKREIEKWLVGELDMRISVGLLGANRKDTLDDHDVIISTAHSASRYILLPHGRKGLLVADEVHHYGARRWSRLLEGEFDRRLGLTATYERNDAGIEEYLNPYFGGSVFRVDYARALADDVIAPFKIAFVAVRFSGEERRRYEEHDEKASRYRRKLVREYGLPEEPFGEFMAGVNHLAIGGGQVPNFL